MIGDKLIITDYHRKAAAAIYKKLVTILPDVKGPVVIAVAGESGSGKSETAAVLADICEKAGKRSLLLQQDDYFIYPPKTNHKKRLEDIGWVGTQEVKLDLIEKNVAAIKEGTRKEIKKPLVNYEADSISEEIVSTEGIEVVIVEGTYTTLLRGADLRTFIDLNYRQTRAARMKRSRDPATDFLEKVLSLEHKIIAAHKQLADLIIPPPDSL